MKFILFDIIWIALLFVILGIILYPIYNTIGPDYPFYFSNSLFIIVAGLCIRFIFFLEYSFMRKWKWSKLLLMFSMPLLLLPLSGYFVDFQEFMDGRGLQTLMTKLTPSHQLQLSKYIRSEMIFFGSSAIISCIALIFRMIISLWRQKNTSKF